MAHIPLIDRLADKIDFFGDNGCWNWTANKSPEGYGLVWVRPVGTRGAHRALYQEVVEEIPSDLVCDHLCRNTSCVNPDHIEIVTSSENIRRGDWSGKARQYHDRRLAFTHCKRGHAFDEENTYIVPGRGTRVCKACQAYRLKIYYAGGKVLS